jgi:Tfp pilus assembly protein PilO
MIRALIARIGARLGTAGSVGLALIVLAGGFFAGTLYPEKQRLETLQREVAELRQRSARAGREASAPASDDLAAFYAFLPASDELPRILETVFRAAQRQSLVLERGEYRVARRPGAGATFQYQLTFPVRGSYPQIRKFVNGALTDVPALSLESVHLERQKIGESVVEAKITLAIHLGQKS